VGTFKAVGVAVLGAAVGGPAAFLFAVLCSALARSPDVLSRPGPTRTDCEPAGITGGIFSCRVAIGTPSARFRAEQRETGTEEQSCL